MKICLASLAPFVGGAEKAMERLAVGLGQRGHQVICALGTMGEVSHRLSDQGIAWKYLPMPHTDLLTWPRYFFYRNRFAGFLKSEKVDILHSNDLPSFQLPGDAAARLGIPRICHHRYIFDAAAIKWFTKPGMDAHVFVSRSLQGDLVSAYPALESSPCLVNHDGLLMPDLPNPDRIPLLKKALNLPETKTVVLYAGQIIPRKGVQDLIPAWKRLPRQLSQKACLVIIGEDLAGEGAYRREMEKLATETGVQTEFRGFQSNVDQWLDAADIVMVPSHVEPLGNATLEAMAHSKPVIGTCVGGIPEMIQDQTTGILVPPGDAEKISQAMAVLIQDPGFARQMGKAARKRCESEFSLEAHAGRAEDLYRSLAP